jgi:DNA-directed RNA polymerase subunit alpha
MEITIKLESIEELLKLKDYLNSHINSEDENIHLGMKIDDLGFTTRTLSALTEVYGIINVSDLIRYSEKEILRLPNMGKYSLTEIKDKLALLGLKLNYNG